MKTLQDFQQLRPALVQRENHRSDTLYARDFAAIIGVDSYTSLYDIWLKRKFGFVQRGAGNSYITAGLNLEQVIAEKYYMHDRFGYILQKGIEVFKQTDTFRIGGIPDFILLRDHTPSVGNKGLEIKTAQADWDELPLDYQMQCQIYMYITGIHEWDLAVLVRGHEYREYPLRYDAEFVNTLLEKGNDFYQRYILGDEEPYDPLCFQKTNEVNLNTALDDLAVEREKLKLDEKLLSAKLDNVELRIKELIGENKGVVGNNWKATYQKQSRTSYDINKICEDYAVDKEAYAKISEFRVLRLAAKK